MWWFYDRQKKHAIWHMTKTKNNNQLITRLIRPIVLLDTELRNERGAQGFEVHSESSGLLLEEQQKVLLVINNKSDSSDTSVVELSNSPGDL